MDMASFIALLFAKNMALLPLGEPKIGTENELAPLARKNMFFWTSIMKMTLVLDLNIFGQSMKGHTVQE